jgi:hypothetical protein
VFLSAIYLMHELIRSTLFTVFAAWLYLIPWFLLPGLTHSSGPTPDSAAVGFGSLLLAGTGVYFLLPVVAGLGLVLGLISAWLAHRRVPASSAALIGAATGLVVGAVTTLIALDRLAGTAALVLGVSNSVLVPASAVAAAAFGSLYLWLTAKQALGQSDQTPNPSLQRTPPG